MFHNERVICPTCSAEVTSERCEHVVACMGPGGFCSPLDGVALPWLSGPAVRRKWSALHVAEAFGDLAALIDAYGAIADWRPGLSARVLWPLLAEFLDEPVAELRTGAGETTEQVWCAANPTAVDEETRAIAELLTQGFAYLTHLATQRPAAAA